MNAGAKEVKGQPGVIFFDAAGTLIRLAQPVGRTYAQTARDHGLSADEARMEVSFRTVWRETPHRPPSPVARADDDRPWWRTLAVETLRRAESPPTDFDTDAWFGDLYNRFSLPGAWRLFEDVPPCLETLQQQTRLAVISNFDGRLRTILHHLGILEYFEELFISSEIGAEKPSAQIFRRALEAMGAEPSACLHVGDDPERDTEGARAVGLPTFLVARPRITLDALTKLYV